MHAILIGFKQFITFVIPCKSWKLLLCFKLFTAFKAISLMIQNLLGILFACSCKCCQMPTLTTALLCLAAQSCLSQTVKESQ